MKCAKGAWSVEKRDSVRLRKLIDLKFKFVSNRCQERQALKDTEVPSSANVS